MRPSQQDMEIFRQAREEVQKDLDAMTEQLRSSGVLEDMERVRAVAQEAVLEEGRRQEMTAMLFSRPDSFLPLPANRPVNEDRIARKVTDQVIDHFEALRIDLAPSLITLRIIGDEIIRSVPGGQKRVSLTEGHRALLSQLSHEHVSTKRLMGVSGYKNVLVVQQTLQKLKRRLSAHLDLDGSPIEGEERRGYRIADGFRIVVDR